MVNSVLHVFYHDEKTWKKKKKTLLIFLHHKPVPVVVLVGSSSGRSTELNGAFTDNVPHCRCGVKSTFLRPSTVGEHPGSQPSNKNALSSYYAPHWMHREEWRDAEQVGVQASGQVVSARFLSSPGISFLTLASIIARPRPV